VKEFLVADPGQGSQQIGRSFLWAEMKSQAERSDQAASDCMKKEFRLVGAGQSYFKHSGKCCRVPLKEAVGEQQHSLLGKRGAVSLVSDFRGRAGAVCNHTSFCKSKLNTLRRVLSQHRYSLQGSLQ
jgi:hypothetical protein